MCGRVVQALLPEIIAKKYEAKQMTEGLVRNWNLGPTQNAAILRKNPQTGERTLQVARWGLIPSWADEKHAAKTINAKAEELTTKPFYRDAWYSGRRCIFPVELFYEWIQIRSGTVAQPFAILRGDTQNIALAGLWEGKHMPNGSVLRSFTVITCEPNKMFSHFHSRMPVILTTPEDCTTWLDNKTPLNVADNLMRPCPDILKMWKVSKDVGNISNNGMHLAMPKKHEKFEPIQGNLLEL